ncbi:MAG: hypothetical protein OHK003_26460 [Anaerolineales bacterium]
MTNVRVEIVAAADAIVDNDQKVDEEISRPLFLFLVILALIIQNWHVIVNDGLRFAPAFIVLNIAALVVGYVVAKLARINEVQTITIAIETGNQNYTVTITVAVTILNDNEMSVRSLDTTNGRRISVHFYFLC